jgi:hypothetical protein
VVRIAGVHGYVGRGGASLPRVPRFVGLGSSYGATGGLLHHRANHLRSKLGLVAVLVVFTRLMAGCNRGNIYTVENTVNDIEYEANTTASCLRACITLNPWNDFLNIRYN